MPQINTCESPWWYVSVWCAAQLLNQSNLIERKICFPHFSQILYVIQHAQILDLNIKIKNEIFCFSKFSDELLNVVFMYSSYAIFPKNQTHTLIESLFDGIVTKSYQMRRKLPIIRTIFQILALFAYIDQFIIALYQIHFIFDFVRFLFLIVITNI